MNQPDSPGSSSKSGKRKGPGGVQRLSLDNGTNSAVQALHATQQQLSQRNLSDETTVECDGEQIHLRAADFRYVEMLGRGQYGEVEKMLHMPTKRAFAVKKLRTSVNIEEQKTTLTDLDVSMRGSECPYMVKFYGALFREGDVWLIMELMDTSLDKFYKAVYSQRLEISEDLLGVISYCVLQALEYMRSKLAKMHRDVKPSNILVNRIGDVKLCDFGISGELVNSIADSNIGCKPYMAPERITQVKGFTIKSDVWSFGITMYELATGTFPYKEWENVFQQLNDVVTGPAPRLPECNTRLSREFHDFVDSCLNKDVRQRPKYEELLRSPYMQRYSLPSYADTSYKEHPFIIELAQFVCHVLDNAAPSRGANANANNTNGH